MSVSMPPGPWDAVIFDLDGTLWDTSATVAASWNAALVELGEPVRFTPADMVAVMGQTMDTLLANLLPEVSPQRRAEIGERCFAVENAWVRERGGALYPGVAEGLHALAAAYPLYIVSNCQRGYIEAFLAWSGLGPLVRDHECFGNTGEVKAANIRRVMARNGLRRPLYVGDTPSDAAAAAEAGAAFVHARYGFGHVPDAPGAESFGALTEALLAAAEQPGWPAEGAAGS